MKITLFVLISVIFVSACGGGSSGSNSTTVNNTATPTAEPIATAEPTPTVTAEPTATATPEPTLTPTPISTPVVTTPSKNNILLIIADDLGLDASAQYPLSSDLPNTPTLNSLASEGIVFDNVWATPACTTTRGTMMTGKHGINSGVTFVPAVMDSTTDTLFRRLANDVDTADYASAVVGKWHLAGTNSSASHPNDSGVNYFSGLLQGVVADYSNWSLTTNGVTSTSTQYQTTHITDIALDWISAQQQPWFMWLAYVAPHSPFHLPPTNLHNRDELTGTDEDIAAKTREYYFAAIEAMDSEIGRLLDSLPDGQRENTTIIYIGDNGTSATVIDRTVFDRTHSKGSLYEGGIRIPMTVSGAGVDRVNEREPALVNTSDLYATIAQLAGSEVSTVYDSVSFAPLLSNTSATARAYNYSEFESNSTRGWAVRNTQYKLIEFIDGTQELYDIANDIGEQTNLLLDAEDRSAVVAELAQFAQTIRTGISDTALDITDSILTNRSANCADYISKYRSSVQDIGNDIEFEGSFEISVVSDKCILHTNVIPNHNFNDGARAFPNDVSEQDDIYEITTLPEPAVEITLLSLTMDNALLLNGVKVDLLAAACFNVGDERVGCNDIDQPWRLDPMFGTNGFNVDSHNAHAQPDGSYHYHGKPNALYEDNDNSETSPLVGFAADGFPIFGPYIEVDGLIRKAQSSYRLKAGNRPISDDDPGGAYDGTYRDDYEYVEGLGDLDQCNGMSVDGVYSYFIIDEFPYILACFTGTPDATFNK